MKMTFVLVATLAVGTLPLTTTYAGPWARDAAVNAPQPTKQQRVAQGARSGQLTRQESRAVAKEQQAVRKDKRTVKSDGKVTVAERKDVRKDMKASSKTIYKEKHDAQVRPLLTPRDPFVNVRQSAQHARLAQAVKPAEVTRPEAARARPEQRRSKSAAN